jgi:hypothetical protein
MTKSYMHGKELSTLAGIGFAQPDACHLKFETPVRPSAKKVLPVPPVTLPESRSGRYWS